MASSIPHNESPHYVARYIENFIDLVENLPNDLARRISQVHELQLDYENILSRLERTLSRFVSGRYDKDDTRQLKLLLSTQHCLLRIQEISDNKLAIVQEALDQLDMKSRELDYDYRLFSAESSSKEQATNSLQKEAVATNTKDKDKNTKKDVCSNKNNQSSSTSSSASQSHTTSQSNRGDRGGSGSTSSSSDLREPPEPTYCVCHQVSYGDMICCDNKSCEIEWFHFQCVALTSKPKGKWYCPNCRGDRSNQPKK